MNMPKYFGLALGAMILLAAAATSQAETKDIIDEWATVQTPKPPELKPVTINPKETALLILDVVTPICNAERTPRCIASLPKLQGLLNQASIETH